MSSGKMEKTLSVMVWWSPQDTRAPRRKQAGLIVVRWRSAVKTQGSSTRVTHWSTKYWFGSRRARAGRTKLRRRHIDKVRNMNRKTEYAFDTLAILHARFEKVSKDVGKVHRTTTGSLRSCGTPWTVENRSKDLYILLLRRSMPAVWITTGCQGVMNPPKRTWTSGWAVYVHLLGRWLWRPVRCPWGRTTGTAMSWSTFRMHCDWLTVLCRDARNDFEIVTAENTLSPVLWWRCCTNEIGRPRLVVRRVVITSGFCSSSSPFVN